MRKFLVSFLCLGLVTTGASAHDLLRDSSDPLFLPLQSNLLSQTGLSYFENGLRIGQVLSVGVTNRLALGGNIHYQQNFDNNQDGFSSFDLGGIYRLVTQAESSHKFIYDVVFGFKFGGSHRVRTPDYADSTYYAGLRFGRQYDAVTIAATLKSSWIFDKYRGMAFIDFNPEAYFRIAPEWRIGVNAGFRKATTPAYDEETLGFKLVREYGRTQYVGFFNYEFEKEEVAFGARVNILF